MKIFAAALIAVVLWGASPVAAKIAVSSLSPMMVAILRTVIGGLIALPVAAVVGVGVRFLVSQYKASHLYEEDDPQ